VTDVSRELADLSIGERTSLEERLLKRHALLAAAAIPRRPRSDPTPLSFAQQRLWFLEQLQPGTPLHNMSRVIRLKGVLDRAVLQQSLDAIVARHEVLRTRIVATNGIPEQIVSPPAAVTVAVTDLRGLAPGAREPEAQRLVADEARKPFDLAHGPLFRAVLLPFSADEHLLVLSMHHIISDGWSRELLSGELTAFFSAFCSDKPAPVPELPIQYGDYAVWQRDWLRGERLERELAYWRNQLRGFPTLLDLPTDYSRPPVRTGRGAREHIVLPQALCEQLRLLSQRENVTLFAIVLAACQTLLARYTGQDDILVGSPIAGRTRSETESLIGLFANTLVLRTDLSGNPTFRELLLRVREVTLGAYDHPDVPFEQLVEELQPERDLSRSPIFQVLLSWQNVPRHPLHLPGMTLQMDTPESGTAKFDLTFVVSDSAGELRVEAEYSTDLFEGATVVRILGHLWTLLDGIVVDPDCRISALPLLTEPERRLLLTEWNAPVTKNPEEATLGTLFDVQVALRPEATALVFQDERLTYRELQARANQLARYLRARGVGREQLVGVCLERSADLIVALLAIIKAGAAYVPLDPSYPPDRLRFMVEDARAGLVLTNRHQTERMPRCLTPMIVCLDLERGAIERESSDPLAGDVHAEDLAYVMYTSGSTGLPKGVAIPHRGIMRLVRDTDFVQLTPADHVAQVCNLTFDVSTWEIWGALLNGATLVVIPRELVLSPRALAAELRERRITSIDVTTALFNQVARDMPDAFRTVRDVQIGGEKVDPARLREVLAAGPPQRLINSYGPAECTTTASWHHVREVDDDTLAVPIGRPIANTPAYVLDRHLELVPIGVPGELHLGGPGLARGYFDRPSLTAERFIPDPFTPVSEGSTGGRLYRTGDRVRWRAEGVLEFLGRYDDQIKLRGQRIEPGEIECALCQHPGVRACIVIAAENVYRGRELVAYVVPEGDPPATDEWRGFLQQRLPDFMVPSSFVALDALPLAPGGKVDRRALPATKDERPRLEQAFVPARDQTEEAVARIWAAVLRLDGIGIHDNFFALGGHSLLATQVVARIRSIFDVEVPLVAIFEEPTIAALAARVASAKATGISVQPPLVPVAREAYRYPLAKRSGRPKM
jgi:amino acid adenylation domain-containing protein